jgi:exopolyphosphatase/guanosine-5'-triphosphate,3'-diphosphate pyrophosphatase
MNTINFQPLVNRITRPPARGNSVGAVIDIGSNSVKLLVGQVVGANVERIYSIGQSVKLGQGAFQTRRLRPEVIDRVAATVADFAATARKFSPSIFRIFATSAVREATNRADFLRTVESRSQNRVEILSGEEEAQLLFEGVRREPGLAGSPLMVVDVGGGSTQVIVSERGAGPLYYSFPFGSLRLLETLGLSDTLSKSGLARCRASAANFILQQVIPAIGLTRFEGGPFNAMHLVGTGKKLRALAAAGVSQTSRHRSAGIPARSKVGHSNGVPVFQASRFGAAAAGGDAHTSGLSANKRPTAPVSLSLKRLSAMIDGLWGMKRVERAAMLGISEEDASVVLTAAITLEAVLQRFDFDVLHASRSSLRHGAILTSFAERRLNTAPNQWR